MNRIFIFLSICVLCGFSFLSFVYADDTSVGIAISNIFVKQDSTNRTVSFTLDGQGLIHREIFVQLVTYGFENQTLYNSLYENSPYKKTGDNQLSQNAQILDAHITDASERVFFDAIDTQSASISHSIQASGDQWLIVKNSQGLILGQGYVGEVFAPTHFAINITNCTSSKTDVARGIATLNDITFTCRVQSAIGNFAVVPLIRLQTSSRQEDVVINQPSFLITKDGQLVNFVIPNPHDEELFGSLELQSSFNTTLSPHVFFYKQQQSILPKIVHVATNKQSYDSTQIVQARVATVTYSEQLGKQNYHLVIKGKDCQTIPVAVTAFVTNVQIPANCAQDATVDLVLDNTLVSQMPLKVDVQAKNPSTVLKNKETSIWIAVFVIFAFLVLITLVFSHIQKKKERHKKNN